MKSCNDNFYYILLQVLRQEGLRSGRSLKTLFPPIHFDLDQLLKSHHFTLLPLTAFVMASWFSPLVMTVVTPHSRALTQAATWIFVVRNKYMRRRLNLALHSACTEFAVGPKYNRRRTFRWHIGVQKSGTFHIWGSWKILIGLRGYEFFASKTLF